MFPDASPVPKMNEQQGAFPPVSQCQCFLWQINVRVTTMDAELEFAILPSTTGKQLFDQVRCALQSNRCLNRQACDRVVYRCLDSKDDRAEGNLVLWPPVPGQQRLLHLAQTEQEGEDNVYTDLYVPP